MIDFITDLEEDVKFTNRYTSMSVNTLFWLGVKIQKYYKLNWFVDVETNHTLSLLIFSNDIFNKKKIKLFSIYSPNLSSLIIYSQHFKEQYTIYDEIFLKRNIIKIFKTKELQNILNQNSNNPFQHLFKDKQNDKPL